MKKIDDIAQFASVVVFDFDGPVCDVFSGCPAASVEAGMREELARSGASMPDGCTRGSDPIELLRWTAANLPEFLNQAEDLLRDAEQCAVLTAKPTRYADEAIKACSRSGRSVAIVSNNSGPAIESYLVRHQLASDVAAVIGRPYAQPDLMKPNPKGLTDIVAKFSVQPSDCVFVGDSTSDIQAAISADVHSIGYAKRPDRIVGLVEAGAECVIGSIADLVGALRRGA
jgi:phosphoglycolate phosphatase-like HAD superfamily hydrolase